MLSQNWEAGVTRVGGGRRRVGAGGGGGAGVCLVAHGENDICSYVVAGDTCSPLTRCTPWGWHCDGRGELAKNINIKWLIGANKKN